MKKLMMLFVLSCLCLSYGLAFPGDKISMTRAFSLVIRGGFASSSFGDLNTTLGSINSLFNPARAAHPDRVVGEILRVPNLFPEWEAELQWTKGRFGVGIGVIGAGSIHQESSLTYTIVDYAGTQIEKRGNESDIRSFPSIALNLYYSRPIRPNIELAFNVGAGYYHIHMLYDESSDILAPLGDRGVVHILSDVSGANIGFHIKGGLEYRLSSRLSVLLDSRWRLARIRNLNGRVTVTSNVYDPEGNLIESANISEAGHLYHLIEEDLRVGVRGERLIVQATPPEIGPGFPSDIRKGFLDLTGFALEMGLRIRLF